MTTDVKRGHTWRHPYEKIEKNEELGTEIDSKIGKYQDIRKKEFVYFKSDYTVLANER